MTPDRVPVAGTLKADGFWFSFFLFIKSFLVFGFAPQAQGLVSGLGWRCFGWCRLDLPANGPDKAAQLAGHCGEGDLRFLAPGPGQMFEPAVQAGLGLPGRIRHRLGQAFAAFL